MRADLSSHDRATVLRPGVRTFKPRRTRMTARESLALVEQSHLLLPVGTTIDFDSIWGAEVPVVMEIGFGSGSATAAMAAAAPDLGILAVDVHTPGVGDLLSIVGQEGLTNVRVMEADALAVLEFLVPIHALSGLRSYFPDPWPKVRHHKRRLVQPAVLTLASSRLALGGFWHLATDWQEYADVMQHTFGSDPRWQGGVIDRPADRPVTHYERRALRDGRTITDLRYELVTDVSLDLDLQHRRA